MDREFISVEPEIVQFGLDTKQLIKVTNHTGQPIENCFFCLYNTTKYQFIPDCFTLQPKQHKLVTVLIKIRNTNENAAKQFAYLKSKNINKRITILNSGGDHSYSQQKLRSPLSGTEQINTLTSRGYQETQKTAYQRLISQKQAYINKLQRKLQELEHCKEKQLISSTKSLPHKQYLQQIQSLNLKVELLLKEKEQLIKDNIELQGKFKEYRILMEGDMRITQLNLQVSESIHEIGSQAQEIRYLQMQCQQFLRKIEEKETRLRQNQIVYVSKIDQIIRQSQKKLQQMEVRIKQQRKQSEIQKEKLVKSSIEKYDEQLKGLKAELQQKQAEHKVLSGKIQQQKQKENKREKKIEGERSRLEEQNRGLKNRMKQLQKSYQQLKEQTIIYKNKLFDNDASSEKIGQYMELALQSCKNQNQILRKSKIDVENSLNQEIKIRKSYESKLQKLEQSILQTMNKIKQLEQQRNQLQTQKMSEQQVNHDKIMQLKSENINLLEKINMNKKNQLEKQKFLEDSAVRLRNFQSQVKKLTGQNDLLSKRLQQAQEKLQNAAQQKQKMKAKIQKYRQEAKKSIRTISQNAKDELKRIEKQKNVLQRKVQELEQITITAQIQKDHKNFAILPRNKIRTFHEISNEEGGNIKNKHPMSAMQEKDKDKDRKAIGIRNQRRQLEQSHARSLSTIDMDKIYGQLGQLRQFKGYVNNAIQRLREYLEMQTSKDQEKTYGTTGNSIFNAINFFKQLEQKAQNKVRSQQKLKQSQKQILFLRGRLAQLQPLVRTIKQKNRKQESLQLNNNQDIDRSAIEYIRQQMKNQYKKLFDALKISEDRYEILRKKIYQQYRSRIIEHFSKQNTDELAFNRIEAVLQRFVQGLGNTSHKEALLAKQTKLKIEARKQAALMKQKLTAINKQLENKQNKKHGNKDTCAREKEQLKLFMIQNDNQYIDNIKNEAKMLTYEAQNARLLEEKSCYLEKITTVEQQLRKCESDLEARQGEIERLKKEVIIITKENSQQIVKQEEQLQGFKKKFSQMQKMEKQLAELGIKQKQNSHLREELQEKRQTIKNLRQREKLLQNLLNESKKNESLFRDREKKQYTQEIRVQQNLNEIKLNNRQLRNENSQLKKKVQSLIQDLNKKNAALKRLKSEGEQYRIKNVKTEQESTEKLRLQIKQLKQQVKKIKQDAEKIKRKKQKQVNEVQAEYDRCRSQLSIKIRSLQSIIRALTDTLRGIYSSLQIVARKKGRSLGELSSKSFDDLICNMGQINSVKVGEFFEELIGVVKGE